MILTVIALFVGLALVALLWALSQKKPEGSSLFEDPSMKLLPSQRVVNALFDKRDFDFAAAQKSTELVTMLETQRRTIALLWLASIRRQAFSAISSFRTASRGQASIRLSDEIRMISQSAVFIGLHSLLVLLVWNVSVFRVRGLLQQVHELSLPLLRYAKPESFAGARVS